MSKIQTRSPVRHTPSFKTYTISGNLLEAQLLDMGFRLPFGMLDYWYFYTDLEGWGKLLHDLTFKSDLYLEDKRDCDFYAFKAFTLCQERYKLNTLAFVIGETPLGRHAFNLIVYEGGFMLFEPNDGYPHAGLAFPIGENDYQPELVLL